MDCGLCPKTIKSEIDPTPLQLGNDMNLKDIISQRMPGKSYVVAYLDYKVLIGTFDTTGFHFYDGKTFINTFKPEYIQKLRIFNKTQEIFIWRSSEGLKGRLRIDETGDTAEVVDACQVLFGTKAEPLDGGFTKITENRGTELTLPFSNLSINEDYKRNRVFIKTRNYIGYNEVNQATYIDCRFVGFSMWDDQRNKIKDL